MCHLKISAGIRPPPTYSNGQLCQRSDAIVTVLALGLTAMTTLLSGALAMTTLLETTSLVHKEMSVWLTRDLIVAHYWAPDAVLKRAPATQVSNGMQNVGVNLRQQAQCNQCLPESFSPKRLLDENKSVGKASFLAHKLVRWILVFVHHLTPRDLRNDSVPR